MAGNNRRPSGTVQHRSRKKAPVIAVRAAGRGLRLEQLEDRSTPAIIQSGIPNWLDAGPTPIINSISVTGIPQSPVVGAVQGVTPHPTDPNILFAGGVNGGVWRTTNATDPSPTWTPLTDTAPSLSVASMDLNPNNPNQLIVGIGSRSSAARISGDLIGVLYTENALAPNPAFRVLQGGGQLINQEIRAVIARGNFLLAAGDKGVYRSLDRGATWTLLSGFGNLPAGSILDAKADDAAPGRVFVAGPNGVFRTDDVTAAVPSWVNVTDPQMNIAANVANIKIAVHNSPGNDVVYVASAVPAAGGGLDTVVWSTNGGVTWTAMDEPTSLGFAVPITDATNASPIQITTAGNHGLATGDKVLIQNVNGNLGANGVWTVTVTAANTFTLDGSVGTGAYTGGGVSRKIFGVNPGNQEDLHFALTADRTNPNLVYIAGDAQTALPNGNGAKAPSGILMRGDRSQPRGFGAFVPSPQWTSITHNNAANGGAPHPDARVLAMDAADNLLVGNDGGVYRRLDPTTSTGAWASVIGNLGLAQFYKVQLDTRNNVLFGGAQDANSDEQLDGSGPAGNPVWNAFLAGDGFWQGVDNTGKVGANLTLRYSMGNFAELFTRQTFDNTNKLLSTETVLLAAPGSPTTPDSGLDGSDKGLFGVNVFTLNSLDGRLMMLGMNKLYEDNDPNPALGKAGDVIANVTPAGFAGRVTSIVYGGRQNGLPITRIAWVGTNAGQLWLRGAAGGFTQITNLPGTGAITTVATDPDDWRTAYVLRNNQVFKTSDAGATWVELTANLAATSFDADGNPADGLTTAALSLAVWDPNPGSTAGGVVVLVGGRGGVFRLTDTSGAGVWNQYGAGLPHTVVDDVEVFGNELVAGTQGRGAWVIPDVSTTILAQPIVRVVGSAGNDSMSLVDDGSNPAVVVVNDGQGNVLRVERTVVQGFEFDGLGGADTVLITANGQPGGDLSFVRYPIAVDLGGDPGDTLILRNAGTSAPTTATITATTVGAGADDNLFNSALGGSLTYTGLQNGTLVLDLGPAAVNGNGVFVHSTSAALTQVIGTNGTDEFRVNSRDDLSGDTLGVGGNLAFDGRGRGADRLVVSDFGVGGGNSNVDIANGVITGLTGPVDGGAVYYGRVPNLIVMGSDNSQLNEQYRVDNPSSTLTLNANGGPDTIAVRSNGLPVFVNSGAGDDDVHVSSLAGDSDAGDLRGIRGLVRVDGGPGSNRLVVSDFGSPTGATVTVTSDQIIGATPVPIAYTASGGGTFADAAGDGVLYLGSDAGSDSIFVTSTQSGFQTAVNGAGGADTVWAAGDSLAGVVWLNGGAGDDSISLDPGQLGNTADALRVSGGGGTDSFLFTGFATDDNVNLTMTGPAAGRATGVGNPFTFDTLTQVNFEGLGGRNNLTVADGTGAGHGTAADPLSGAVFRPTGETAGTLAIAGGAVGPTVGFDNINGNDAKGLVFDGDPNGVGARDTLTVLGVSDDGLQSTLGETTAADGTDDIFVSDQGVTLSNASLGFLRSVAVARSTTTGLPTVSSLVVKAGNEASPRGDNVTVVPSSQLNILVDGGRGANKLNISSAENHTLSQVSDPNLGPPQTRVTTDSGASFGFVNFPNAGGAARRIFAVGADQGGGPRVQVFDADTHQILFDSFVFDPAFTGGVRVATGDVTGDGVPDVIVAAGPGGGPEVDVIDGVTFETVGRYFAYEPTFTGGVYVAVADVTGDGVGDIIAGSGNGGGPLVRVLNAQGIDIGSFFAYEKTFRGGVRVAGGDVLGTGAAQIITTPGAGGGPRVRAFQYGSFKSFLDYFALDPSFTGGIYLAAGDMDGDGKAEIAVGPGSFESPDVLVRRSGTGETIPIGVFDIGAINSPEPLPAVSPETLSATGTPTMVDTGFRVGMTAPDSTGKQQLLVGRGFGFPPRVHAFTLDPASEAFNVVALDGAWDGGIYVG